MGEPTAADNRHPVRVADVNAALRLILEGTATDTGERFFEALVVNLAKVLDTDSAWVTEYIPDTGQLQSLAFWTNGRLEANFRTNIRGTPCQEVIETTGLIHYPENVVKLYPQTATVLPGKAASYMGVPLLDAGNNVMGNLAVMDTRPMPEEDHLLTIIKIFAARASAELQRMKAESKVRKSEEKYRRIIETTGEGFMMTDAGFRIVDVNRALCKMVGYSRMELIGKRPIDFATEAFKNYLLMNESRVAASESIRLPGTVVSKSGRRIPILIQGNILQDSQGGYIGHINFVVDMTEHKRALALAGEVQRSLLPQHNPVLKGFEIAGKAVSSDEVGGDYYDFLDGRDCSADHLSIAVGDVTGHGVEASLLMTTARALLRMHTAHCGDDIAHLVSEMNRHLTGDFKDSGKFMTLFYARLDPQSNRLDWVRAGHPPAYLLQPGEDRFQRLMGAGLALGIDADFEYRQNRLTDLVPGQVIVIATDGIWEATNSQGDFYGEDRFLEVIRRNRNECANRIVESVYADLEAFTSGLKPADDMTLVVVKVTGGHDRDIDMWQI